MLAAGSSSAWARDLYVSADAKTNNGQADKDKGTQSNPFGSLAEVEAASLPGDTIYVLGSKDLLDGGLQLKDGQSLIGQGANVTTANEENSSHARLTNSTSAHLNGDAVRLGNNNTVKNIHVTGAWRGGILGFNVTDAVIDGNLVTNNMNQHTMQEIQTDFIIYQGQRNHFGAITLFGCGPAASSQCTIQDPTSPGITTQHATITNNVIKDVAVEGIIILNDTGIVSTYDLAGNSVDGVSLHYAGFWRTDLQPPLVPEVIRSRAFTMIAGNEAYAYVNINGFTTTRCGPEGDFASDSTVFVTFGERAIISCDVRNVHASNPDFTGEIVNADQLEFTSFGSDGIFDARVRDSVFEDSVSTNVKLISTGGAQNGGSWLIDIADTKLLNKNPRCAVEASLGSIGFQKIAAAGALTTENLSVTLHNVTLAGHRRGVFISNLNSVDMAHLNLFAEDSIFANTTNEGIRIYNQNGVIENPTIDVGGGPLGSQGRNSFINNGTTPSDAAITIANDGTPDITVYASNNYWGGGAPVSGPGEDLYSTGPVQFVVDGYLKSNPNK